MVIELVSKTSDGTQGSQSAAAAALSANGRFVAFQTRASELQPDDGNNSSDLFVRDLATGNLALVSADATGGVGDRGSFAPAISGSGAFVAFESDASTLVADDGNGLGDIFVRDILDAVTVRVSTARDGGDANGASANPSISADGRWIAFESLADNLVEGDLDTTKDIFLVGADRATVEVTIGPGGAPADGDSSDPTLSTDGRYLAFASDATNLVTDDTNGKRDVFVLDRVSGEIERVSLGKRGTEANSGAFDPAISADGRKVAFHSGASSLVKNDENGFSDIFIVDQLKGKIVRVSVGPKGSEADGDSFSPSLSADGRFVTFHSDATNLVAGDTNGTTDVFVYDSKTKTTVLVSDPSGADTADGPSFSEGQSLIAANGTVVAFTGAATNLVSDDLNGVDDIFVANVLFPAKRGGGRRVLDERSSGADDILDGAEATGRDPASQTALTLDPASLLTPPE